MSERAPPSIEVVVCVHNALADVRACLASLRRTSHVGFRVLVVNDGSDAKTTQYLRNAVGEWRDWDLIENAVPRRYTQAANQALLRTNADYVVLLNSDTVVPPTWLSRLIACGESSAQVGLIGPVSNAAGWQSVPVVLGLDGDWMVNELPVGVDVVGMDHLVSALAPGENPTVPLLNGFCLTIKRSVLESIGLFDETLSPDGFAEETDFCFRAADAGFSMVVADSVYVHHAKSRSYGHAERRRLARIGEQKLLARYGEARLNSAYEALRNHRTLAELRRRLGPVWAARSRDDP